MAFRRGDWFESAARRYSQAADDFGQIGQPARHLGIDRWDIE